MSTQGSLRQRLLVSCGVVAALCLVSFSASGADSASDQGTQLQEVIVTAQKKTQNLLDVPVPVTAISADSLSESNQVLLQDYYTRVPGLSVSPTLQGQTTVAIRGINTGYGTNPVVGFTVDDVPYGSSTQLGGGPIVPDLDPADLARVEVLRGPQGTLYGASTLGGLVKYVTVDPSLDRLSGRVEAGTSGTYDGADLGYSFRGSVNVPLSDTWAIRASGFTRRDPGYIDNPILHLDGLNENQSSGGRLAALWRPSDTFSLKLSALYEDSSSEGSNDVNVPTAGYPTTAGLGDLQQNYIRGVGGYRRKVEAYSAIVVAKLGSAELTAISGYNVNSFFNSTDFTSLYGQYTLNQFGTSGTVSYQDVTNSKFTQELRLEMPLGHAVDWLMGAFYTYEKASDDYPLLAQDPPSGEVVGNWGTTYNPTTYQEYAAFTDFTFKITDRFDVQVGAREAHLSLTSQTTQTGPFTTVFLGQPSPVINPQFDTRDSAFTYLLTPRFKLSPDFMAYARFASGYRPGGPNAIPDAPPTFAPDKTNNYELGVKGDFFAHTLSIDASIYYIDWKDIQITLYTPLGGGITVTEVEPRARASSFPLSPTPRRASRSALGWLTTKRN